VPIRRVPTEFDQLYPAGSRSATECAMNLVLTADLIQTRIARLLREFDLTPSSGLALSTLADADAPLPPNQIAERMILTRATITGLVDSLERRDYVTREPHPSDRRMHLVQITPEGRRIASEFRTVVHSHQSQWFDVLNEKQRSTLLKLLEPLQERLQQDG
jgi:DNA-binding MarR family transcriptional regulator